MPTDQFNIRLGDDLARRVRMLAAEHGIKPRDVIAAALIASYPSWEHAQAPVPIDGQLTVDEAPVTAADQGAPKIASAPASRRPRAADNAKRSNGRATGPPAEESGGASSPAGCPECSGDITEGKCEDCGWLAST